jgi:hypothetical protein
MFRTAASAPRLRRPWVTAVRRLFIQTETTPNPDSLKFIPGKPVLESGTRDYRSLKDAQASPLARRLFATEGVSSVFLSSDFVTVGKQKDSDWVALKPLVFGAIMDHYAAGPRSRPCASARLAPVGPTPPRLGSRR